MLEKQDKQNNKIKIVYVIPTLDSGGAERFFVDLILNLDLDKFAPTFLLFKSGGLWLKELEEANIPIILLSKKYKIDLINFLKLFSNLKKIRPEIVHTQLGGDFYGRIAAKILKVPVIISTEQNLNPEEKFWPNLFKKFTSCLADSIIAISSAVKNDLVSRYNIKPDKIKIIPNGVNIKKFLNYSKTPDLPIKNVTFPRKIILGTIGRLTKQKGQVILIKALAKLKNYDFECLIAGVGSLEESLNNKIKSLNLSGKVKLVGKINDVPNFLNSLDAFIFPSIWEGQGIVLLEAALAGLPIIASEVDGIKDLLSNETAYLTKVGDVEDLSSKIAWLLNNLDSVTVRSRSNKLREEVINRYSIEKICAEYQKLYLSLLNSK